MATKINLQQLAKTLAQKRNLPQKDAEAFLKTFFDAIIENVTADKMVKIKGLQAHRGPGPRERQHQHGRTYRHPRPFEAQLHA